jgi:hypothetical protein
MESFKYGICLSLWMADRVYPEFVNDHTDPVGDQYMDPTETVEVGQGPGSVNCMGKSTPVL